MQKMYNTYKNELLRPTVWTNIFFFIPIGLAFGASLEWYALLSLAATALSFVHHFFGRKSELLTNIDVGFATVVIAFNFALCYLSGIFNIYVAFASVSVVIAFYFFFREREHAYEINHSFWHLGCAAISFWCVTAYLVSQMQG